MSFTAGTPLGPLEILAALNYPHIAQIDGLAEPAAIRPARPGGGP